MEVRCAAPCPPFTRAAAERCEGPRSRSENTLERQRLQSWKHPFGTPFRNQVCNAERVCRGDAPLCSPSAFPRIKSPGGWLSRGAQRTAEFPPSGPGTSVSTYCVPGGVLPPPPHPTAPLTAAWPPQHCARPRLRGLVVSEARPLPQSLTQGWQGRVTGPALGPFLGPLSYTSPASRPCSPCHSGFIDPQNRGPGLFTDLVHQACRLAPA